MNLKMLLSLSCCFIAAFLGESVMTYDPESSITGLYTGPYFDPLAKKNLSAHLGEQATLPCTVRQLGDKSVSWVRMRDADILTVDRYTFVGDERFESHFSEPRETWNLVIKYVQERDAGLYECQVSTEPKMSQLFTLRVVVPEVGILPPGDRYMKAGSRVQIDCHINNVVEMPDYIFWYKGDARIMENREKNVLITMKKTGPEAITSTLTIIDVPARASGNYTCMPSNLHSASVTLHVLNEKNPAAMQGERNGASPTTTKASATHHNRNLLLLLLLLLILLVWASWWSPVSSSSSSSAFTPTDEDKQDTEKTDTGIPQPDETLPSNSPFYFSNGSLFLFLALSYQTAFSYSLFGSPPIDAIAASPGTKSSPRVDKSSTSCSNPLKKPTARFAPSSLYFFFTSFYLSTSFFLSHFFSSLRQKSIQSLGCDSTEVAVTQRLCNSRVEPVSRRHFPLETDARG